MFFFDYFFKRNNRVFTSSVTNRRVIIENGRLVLSLDNAINERETNLEDILTESESESETDSESDNN
jgi:uncharacterized protein YueI